MNKSYVPLYRKYRPQKLEEIVGQEHVKKALTNAIESDRISHAYLFTGPRGTGKTSTARIFAKSLNCVKGPTIAPCNECENCINITKSIPIDVIEIDAASNRSVSDAEEIIQNVAMAPIRSRYKIYIIDEVHMLTPTAFNALLKTLEEPPANVIFILATTEVHKVLDTIKSRCQRFDFKRITTDDITKHLRYISDNEKINITDDALNYIASNSAGGMRDSIALLDQLSVLNSTKEAISVDDINRLLGRLSFGSLSELFENIIKSDSNSALEVLNNIYNQGNEPSQILSNFLEYLRNALILKSTETKSVSGVVQLNEEQIKKLSASLNNIETHQIVSLIDKCSAYIKELKLSTNPKLWLDVAVLDMANLTQNTKLEDLQNRLSQLENGHAVKPSISYNTPPMPVNKMEISEVKKEEQKPVKAEQVTEVKTQPSAKESSVSEPPKTVSKGANSEVKDLWQKFLDNVSSFASRAILKQNALPVTFSAQEVVIAIKNDTWLGKLRDDADKMAQITAAAKAVTGGEPKITLRMPMQGDDKLREGNTVTAPAVEPKKPLIREETQSKEEISDAIKQIDEIEEDDVADSENDTAEKKTEIADSSSKREDYAFHSDNVNMVIDLFEGKIIE